MKGNDRQFTLIMLPNVVCNRLRFVRPRIRIILLYISRCFTAVLVWSVKAIAIKQTALNRQAALADKLIINKK